MDPRIIVTTQPHKLSCRYCGGEIRCISSMSFIWLCLRCETEWQLERFNDGWKHNYVELIGV